MYTEEPRRRINWGNVIKKGIIIILIALLIFLIIWLFTRNNNKNVNVEYDNTKNNNNNNIVEPIQQPVDDTIDHSLYSEIFITNYTYYHTTAKDYFLINEIPTNGNTIRYSLRELINKGIILKAKYGNTTCDLDSSYVAVTNDNGNYTMDTVLSCGSEFAKTTEKLGCNLLCENCSKPTTIEYQFKQAYKDTETTYSCPKGYTKTGSGSNTSCVKTDSTTTSATKNVTYSCPNGYTKIGSGISTKCIKSNSSTIDATKVVTYSCPTGYLKSGSGDKTICSKVTNVSVDAKSTTSYSCPTGYTLNGTKCTKTNTTNATAKTTYSCPTGYSQNGSQCTKTDTTNASYNTTYSCPTGYSQNGSQCTKTETINGTPHTTYSCKNGTLSGDKCIVSTYTDATPVYSCSKGTLVNTRYCRIASTSSHYESYTSYKGATYAGCSYSGSYTDSCGRNCTKTYYKYYCSKTTYTDKDANVTYKCVTGTVSGNKCYTTTSVKATKTTTYSCPAGYSQNGSQCSKTTTKNATATTTYSCPYGYTQNGNKCSKTTTKNATTTTTYSCKNGTLSGDKCITTDTTNATANKNYYCEKGYSLSGTKCYKNSSETTKPIVTTTYKCDSNYTLNGTKCNTTSSSNVDPIKNTTYSCEKGYSKISLGDNPSCTKGSVSTVAPTKSTKTVTKYKYKWSPETSLQGWTKTGKTRKVTAK